MQIVCHEWNLTDTNRTSQSRQSDLKFRSTTIVESSLQSEFKAASQRT